MKKQQTALNLERMSVPALVSFSKHVIGKMTSNAHFTTPSPTLARMTQLSDELANLQNVSKHAPPENTILRNIKRGELRIAMKTLAGYVEGIANQDLITAAETILSAGFDLRKQKGPVPLGFRIAHGKIPGQVVLRTRSILRSTYQWQMTTDPNLPTSWIDLPATRRAKSIVPNLTTGTRYHFRWSAVTPNGNTAWSNVLNMLVL